MPSQIKTQSKSTPPMLLALLAALCLFPGCNSQPGASQSTGPTRLRVAGVIANEDQFFRLVEFGMRDAAKKLDVELLAGNSQGAFDKEISLIDTYVVRGVDALAISPLSEKASAAALKRAHDRGVKIVPYNANLAADFPVASVESNQYDLGQSTGKEVVQYIEERLGGKADIATIGFLSLLPDQAGARAEGFLDEVTKLPGVKIVARQEAWMAPEAANAAASILTANPDLDILWSANEGGTVGAVTAVKNSGRAGKVVVFGTDASRQLADFLLADDNILQAVTGQQPFEIGRKAVQAAVDALQGKTVSKKTALPGVLLTRRRPDEVRAFRSRLEALEKQTPAKK